MISIDELKKTIKELEFLEIDFDKYDLEVILDGLQEAQIYQKNAYTNMWRGIDKWIEGLIEETNDFGMVIKKLLEVSETNPITSISEGILPRAITSLGIPHDLCSFTYVPGKRLVALNGEYSLVDKSHNDFVSVDYIIKNLSDDVDCLVEFGSGWGSNLSCILMGSGRADIKYVSCEQSATGRNCFDNLFGLLNGVNYSSHEFDFYKPNFDMITGHNHVFAFTNAAIEQIAFLPLSFFIDLLDVAEKVTLIFYEPIGWQRALERQKFIVKALFDELSGFKKPVNWHRNNYIYKFDNTHILDNAASWSLRMRYNKNLLSLIQYVHNNKIAKLVHGEYDVYSENPLNPYSLFALKSFE